MPPWPFSPAACASSHASRWWSPCRQCGEEGREAPQPTHPPAHPTLSALGLPRPSACLPENNAGSGAVLARVRAKGSSAGRRHRGWRPSPRRAHPPSPTVTCLYHHLPGAAPACACARRTTGCVPPVPNLSHPCTSFLAPLPAPPLFFMGAVPRRPCYRPQPMLLAGQLPAECALYWAAPRACPGLAAAPTLPLPAGRVTRAGNAVHDTLVPNSNPCPSFIAAPPPPHPFFAQHSDRTRPSPSALICCGASHAPATSASQPHNPPTHPALTTPK